MKTLRVTESKFQNLGDQKMQAEVAQVFFDDLRSSYEEVLSDLQKKRSGSEPKAMILATALSSSPQVAKQNNPRYALAAQAVFRVFEQNELAYKLVADTGTLVFDLEVNSNPVGAVISYHRRGDPYRENPTPTNSVIKALPYAIWIIRFQKQGFRDQELEHDPFREPNHIVSVELSKK